MTTTASQNLAAGHGAALLRIALGTMWITHALLKIFVFTLPGTAQFFESVGLPGFMAYAVVAAELAGGAALLLGFYGRQASLLLAPVLAVVVWVHWPNGWCSPAPRAAGNTRSSCWWPRWPNGCSAMAPGLRAAASGWCSVEQTREQAMKLTLISHTLCPYVQRAAIVLAEKGVAFERRDVDLADKPDWFKAVSPLGKTPVLLAGDDAIFESAVICEYLDDTLLPRLHPGDALQRARHRAWMEFGSSVLNTIGAFTTHPMPPRCKAAAKSWPASSPNWRRCCQCGGRIFRVKPSASSTRSSLRCSAISMSSKHSVKADFLKRRPKCWPGAQHWRSGLPCGKPCATTMRPSSRAFCSGAALSSRGAWTASPPRPKPGGNSPGS